jgi:uncharacterized protein (TIGR03083 family)
MNPDQEVMTMSQREGQALITALDGVAPSAATACAGWTAHHIVAHLAAGSKEIADLIEEKLAGRPPRPTRAFEDREPAFRALPEEELRAAWHSQIQRKTEAQNALAEVGGDSTFDFTGTALTVAQIVTHSRSEAAVHRWDITGTDDVSDELLAQPELTRHAVTVLNSMSVLKESAATRIAHGHRLPLRIVLRAPGQPDVVLAANDGRNARFELVCEGTADGDAVVRIDAAHRLLILWGRRPSKRPVTIQADEAVSDTVSRVLWPNAISWR